MAKLWKLIFAASLILGIAPWVWADTSSAVNPGADSGTPVSGTTDATAAPDNTGTDSAGAVSADSTDAGAPTETAVSQPTVIPTTGPGPSAAATTVPDYELNAVVITGTKTQLKILDSPADIKVVTQDDIKTKDVGFFNDALTGIAGVEVDQAGGIGSQAVTVSIRGVPGWEKNLILLDGFELNQLGNERPFWNRIPEDLVDHVEVVEGPFSALWGRNADGGVINVITKEPEGELFNFSENWNSAGDRTTNVDYENKTNDGLFAYYLGFQNTGIDGYTQNQYVQATPKGQTGAAPETVTGYTQTTTDTGTPVVNIGQVARSVWENDNYTAKLYFNPSEDQSFNLLVNYSYWDQPDTNATGQVGSSFLKDSVTGNPATVLNGTVALGNTGQQITVNQSQFLTAPGENGFFGSYLQYKGKENDNLNLTGSFAWTAGPLHIAEGALPTADTPFSGTGTGTDMTADWEAFANIQAEQKLDNHDIILGFNWDQADFTSYNLTFPNWTEINNYTEYLNQGNGDNETTDSVFAQDQWKIVPSLTAFIGARWDHWISADGFLYNTLQTQEQYFPTETFDQVSPKVSLVYKIDENGSLRTSWGQAFNPPTSADLYLFSSGNDTETLPNPQLKPEVDTAWEIGGEYEFPSKTTLSATYFNNSFNNLIYEDTEPNGVTEVSQYYNAGQAQINGVESSIKQDIGTHWDVFANYTHLDDKITSNTAQPLSVGKQIPTIPSDEVDLGLDFKPKDWDFSLFGTYQSKRYTTAANTDTVNGVQGSFDPFAIANFKAIYKFNGGNVSAGVDNIFNLQYYSIYQNVGTTFNLGAGFYIL
jgi:iron complex outermembrane receptor protein